MTGRQENDYKTEEMIEKKLEYMPDILKMYYLSMESKTAQTKKVYINYLIGYFEYLQQKNINIYNINSFNKIRKMDLDEYFATTRFRYDTNGNRVENGKSIRRSRMFAIASFYNFLYTNDIIDKNPCEKIQLPKLSSEINVVSLDKREIEVIKNRIADPKNKHKKRDLAMFVLGIRTGLRVTSMIEINIEDIDFNNNSIVVTEKGNKTRLVYFGNDTKRILIDYINERGDVKETNALFVTDKHKRVTYAVPRYVLKKYTSGLDKHITPHKMRSTCATNLCEKQGDIYLVADVLGHSNISNTRRYAKISEIKRKNAADILDRL